MSEQQILPPDRPARAFSGRPEPAARERFAPTITVLLEPRGLTQVIPRPKTVLQLMHRLGVKRGVALVIRDGGLLTEDREILPGDYITIRLVTSSG